MKNGRVALALLICSLLGQFLPSAAAAQLARSTVDRPDEVSGYQVHVIYVAAKDSSDYKLDSNGQIDSWAKEANKWLLTRLGHTFIFDTYEGTTDVSFMQSSYSASELCTGPCDGLSMLENEYQAQNRTYNGSKTLVFIVGNSLSKSSCGWADTPGNLVIIHDLFNDGCNASTDNSETGISGAASTLIHELIHSYGINHQCFNSSDIMIGTPECAVDKETFGHVTTTIDSPRKHYVGSEASDGIDLLKMPVWSDTQSNTAYSQIKSISNNKFVPQLDDGTVYAVIGATSKKFDWEWEKDFSPEGNSISCQFTSGATVVVGKVEKSACTFAVPANLRAGKSFTVTENWNAGPWHGSANVKGTLVRADLTSNPCTEFSCYVGGTTNAFSSCWSSDVTQMRLQQLNQGRWVDIAAVGMTPGGVACTDKKFPNSPAYKLKFTQTGTFIYRWFMAATSQYESATDTPFAVIVNEDTAPEPSSVDVDAAQAQAVISGKIADAAAVKLEAAAKAAAIAALKRTITCSKGKVLKKVTALNPVCPTGYKKLK